MKNGLTEKVSKAKSAVAQRTKELAKNEVLEIKKIFVLFRCDYDRERMLIQFGL